MSLPSLFLVLALGAMGIYPLTAVSKPRLAPAPKAAPQSVWQDTSANATTAPSRITPVVRVAATVGPAVVNIYQDVPHRQQLPWPYSHVSPSTRTSTSLGSGVIIDPDGFVLTNAHVISPQGRIRVQLTSGETLQAQVVQLDPANDVALLKVAADRPLPTAKLGSSGDVMVGETVIAIGNPLGNASSVTAGIISSIFRDVQIPGAHGERFRDIIQLDAAINPGNSGGPLMNVLGEVIGINWAIARDAEGIGFAIPIDRVRESLMDTLFNPMVLANISVGLTLEGDARGRTVHVAAVTPGGAGAAAGLLAGDRVISLADQEVAWEFDFNKALYYAKPGDTLPIVVERDRQEIQSTLLLAAQESPMQYLWRTLGLRVVDHPKFFGVMIDSVDPRGVGAQLPLRQGDLIDGLNGVDVNNTLDLFEVVRQLPAGHGALVNLFRNGQGLRGQLVLR
ncbi:MAG: serine protease Do [Pseudohongiellaceae bacterium]|jgi:serine protease Do